MFGHLFIAVSMLLWLPDMILSILLIESVIFVHKVKSKLLTDLVPAVYY